MTRCSSWKEPSSGARYRNKSLIAHVWVEASTIELVIVEPIYLFDDSLYYSNVLLASVVHVREKDWNSDGRMEQGQRGGQLGLASVTTEKLYHLE